MLIGIVGKPSSGKSTFFNAATMGEARVSPVPFTTIDSNVGIGYVSFDCACKELGVKCEPRQGFCKDGRRFVPVKLVDVGGLVPGSHEGRGLGNKFLDDLRQASVLIQVVDASGLTDFEGNPTKGFDPVEEVKFLEDELDYWIEGKLKQAIEKVERKFKSKKFAFSEFIKELATQLSGLQISRSVLEEVSSKISFDDTFAFARELRKRSKPTVIAANKIDLREARENLTKLQEYCKKEGKVLVPTSAEAELALKKAAEKGLIDYLPGDGFKVVGNVGEEQRKALEFIRKEVVERFGSTGVQECLNRAVFEVLGYIAVYPVANSSKLSDNEGKVLPDVFLVPKGTTVRELAYKIHSEIGEKFVCGIDARTGKRLSADHRLNHKDIVEIVFRK